MAMAETWYRAADSAAAVHQIRNRLQSIIIEAALLKRTAGSDPAALARIGALAQDGAGYLELFGDLLPRPALEGTASVAGADGLLAKLGVAADEGVSGVCVRCHAEALEELLRTLLGKAIPFRGFRATKIVRGNQTGDRAELLIELEPAAPDVTTGAVTPWMRALQMSRDLGGSLELHSGEPPVVKLHLPMCQ